MSVLWIADSQGRVLGPVTVDVVRDLLAAGRMGDVARVSRDGKTWVAASQVPELRLAPPGPAPTQASELAKASQLREQLRAMRTRPAHEVLGVPATASLDEHRTAFFARVKRFHPARLPEGTHAELRAACKEVFDFLGSLMQQTERRLASELPTRPAAPVPRPLAVAPREPVRTAPPPKQAPPASYRFEDFVGFENGRDMVEATVRVNLANVGIFTDHSLANFSSGGVFLPSERRLPLGTMLDLRFVFEQVERHIQARGKVIWENAGVAKKLITGVGVRFIQMAPADKQFIQTYLKEAPKEARQVLRF